MTALLRYQTALLLRSQRWLAPLVLYAVVVTVGVWAQPILDSLGWAAGALLPVAAWVVRVCTNQEPAAARNCVAAAAGPARAHLAALLAALGFSLVLGAAGVLFTAAVSDPRSSDHAVAVPVAEAVPAGLLAACCCALLGTAVGALCNRPLLRSPARSIPATLVAGMAVLLMSGSPANAAVSDLVTGSRSGTVTVSWWPPAVTCAVAAGAVAVACALSSRRS